MTVDDAAHDYRRGWHQAWADRTYGLPPLLEPASRYFWDGYQDHLDDPQRRAWPPFARRPAS
jgi:hypothetical protein